VAQNSQESSGPVAQNSQESSGPLRLHLRVLGPPPPQFLLHRAAGVVEEELRRRSGPELSNPTDWDYPPTARDANCGAALTLVFAPPYLQRTFATCMVLLLSMPGRWWNHTTNMCY
jgi:hypothetical protein